MLAYGRLVRLSLAASALADAAAGILLGAGSWPGGWHPFALLAASACVYHGGMALNDWADREHDARTRPERPIPAGEIPARTALLLGLALLGFGVILAWSACMPAGWIVAGVAATALLYDLAGRGPWLGPGLLAACRAGNLGAGVAAGVVLTDASATWAQLVAIPFAYGAYVFVVSRLGRLEDGEDELATRKFGPAALLAFAAAILVLPALLPRPSGAMDSPWPAVASFVVGAAGAFGLLRVALSSREHAWTRAEIPRLMGMALRRLLVFTAAVAVLTGGTTGIVGAAAILAGFPVSHALRRLFPPS